MLTYFKNEENLLILIVKSFSLKYYSKIMDISKFQNPWKIGLKLYFNRKKFIKFLKYITNGMKSFIDKYSVSGIQQNWNIKELLSLIIPGNAIINSKIHLILSRFLFLLRRDATLREQKLITSSWRLKVGRRKTSRNQNKEKIATTFVNEVSKCYIFN